MVRVCDVLGTFRLTIDEATGMMVLSVSVCPHRWIKRYSEQPG